MLEKKLCKCDYRVNGRKTTGLCSYCEKKEDMYYKGGSEYKTDRKELFLDRSIPFYKGEL
jgi:hypothetical protein